MGYTPPTPPPPQCDPNSGVCSSAGYAVVSCSGGRLAELFVNQTLQVVQQACREILLVQLVITVSQSVPKDIMQHKYLPDLIHANQQIHLHSQMLLPI